MPKVILISQFPLPYSKIGSWTTMYRNYLESQGHQIDFIVCEEPGRRFDGVEYGIISNSLRARIRRQLRHYRVGFVDKVSEIVQANENYLIQFVDNFSLSGHVHKMLVGRGLRHRCHLQFFYHGFAPFQPTINETFFEQIDEVVLLTHDSYKAHLLYYPVFPFRVSVLHNGIDTSRFCNVSAETKQTLKETLGVKGKRVFIWCSQDRPKKGLDLILEAWKTVHADHPDTLLWVIGADRNDVRAGVRFLGKIPNDDLPKYYQASDCYVYPTLWHEGFGLSLVEALNCGCYCIASKQGGVPEVLEYGRLGKLIENPNFIEEWVNAMDEYLSGRELPVKVDGPLYTMQQWNDGMNRIIALAKARFS